MLVLVIFTHPQLYFRLLSTELTKTRFFRLSTILYGDCHSYYLMMAVLSRQHLIFIMGKNKMYCVNCLFEISRI